MPGEKILIVEDDPEVIRLLTQFFNRHQIEVLGCDSSQEAHEILKTFQPAVIVLDVMLRGSSGVDFCREVRRYSSVPIIMLTALGQVMDRIVGLEVGADDYMTKPFEPRELLARIRSVTRRFRNSSPSTLRFSDMEINLRERRVFTSGSLVDLSSSEYEMLIMLVQKAGQVIDRDALLQHLRGLDCDSYSRSVDTIISRLRTKLHDNAQNSRFIKTVWGVGYVFVAAERP